MGLYDSKPCPCGSGKNSYWLSDIRGIPLKRVCSDCVDSVMKKYRPEIFTNPEYWTYEPVEAE